RSSLRMRFGSWLYRLPPSNGAICAPTSHASPCSMRAYASERVAFPARSDLISVPVRTMPASTVSSMVKSWRDLRWSATVISARRSRRSPIRDSGRGGAEDLERLGEVRVGARRKGIGQGHHHIRREADRVDPALRRGQPASDGQLEGATLPAELLPLLDGALP